MFFVPADANGAESFEVLSVRDGKQLYSDEMVADAFKSATVSGDAMHLVYTRGYGGSCSLLTGGAGCWASIMKEEKFGKAVSQQAPPIKDCQTSNADPKAQGPKTDPSMVIYDVDITIEEGKKSVVNSRGPVRCCPRPDLSNEFVHVLAICRFRNDIGICHMFVGQLRLM